MAHNGAGSTRQLGAWFLPAVVASFLLILPCVWQRRIQAGDLSSHVYNAWLAKQVETGTVKGLEVVHPWTNVLFDLLLSRLIDLAGTAGAQRFLISCLVLNFFWSAFALSCAFAGRRPWFLTPLLAILAYGWVFHAGFCNFYLALGLSLWAFVLLRKRKLAARLAAAPLLLLAVYAHALPAAWTIGCIGYAYVAERIPEKRRIILLAAALCALVLFRVVLNARAPVPWLSHQIAGATGADQAWVFGRSYFVITVGLLAMWAVALSEQSWKDFLAVPMHLYVLTAAAVLLIPTNISVPGYRFALTYISDRMSLATGVTMCLVAARARPGWPAQAGLAALAAAFFGLVYMDTRALNRLEDGMEMVVKQLPPGSRVVSALGVCDPAIRLDPVVHMVDRVCVGRCFSYANYEPSTGQFRVRAVAPNAAVVDTYTDSNALQVGTHVVRQRDVPLYQISLCDPKSLALCTRLLQPGETAGRTCLPPHPALLFDSSALGSSR